MPATPAPRVVGDACRRCFRCFHATSLRSSTCTHSTTNGRVKADAAVAALTANGDAKFLAGGQSLLPTMRLRLAQPAALIDVTRIASMKEIRGKAAIR